MNYLRTGVRRVIVFILTWEARAIVAKYKPKIILVTGSVGKTSAKDAVYTALSEHFFIRKSEKSFNSDLGVPLTVIGAPNAWHNPLQWLRNIIDGASLLLSRMPYPKFLVIEVGADRPGDITRGLRWLTPDAVVATRFPDIPVHVEFYASPEDVFEEEAAPLGWLSSDGLAVVNADDPRAAGVSVAGHRITFGFSKDAQVRATRFHIVSKQKMPVGIGFEVSYKDHEVKVMVPGVLGRTHAYAVLAGIAVAIGEGIPLAKAAAAFAHHVAPSGRMHLLQGIGGSLIIDDSYNASPVATEEALQTLSLVSHRGKRIAMLGDMLELGSFSVSEHARIGEIAARSADILITVGIRARGIADAARKAGMPDSAVHQYKNSSAAAEFVISFIGAGDVVLVKGSQSIRMERIVEALLHDPAQTRGLLVRQESHWQKI